MNDRARAIIGLGAFIIGGLLARDNALEGVEKIEKILSRNKKEEPPKELDSESD